MSAARQTRKREQRAETAAALAYAEEEERAFCGFLLTDPIETLARSAGLSSSDLNTPIIRRAYVVALTRQANGLPIDPYAIQADMGRIAPLTDAEQDTLHHAVRLNLDGGGFRVNHVESLVVRIREVARQRRGQVVVEEARRALEAADPESTAKVLHALREELEAIDADHRVSAGPVKPWRTPAEILAAAETNLRTWLWPEVIPFASRSLLIGPPKTAGKSTLLWFLLALATKGAAIDGSPIPPTKFVVLTEEGDLELADKLRAFGIDGDAGLVLSRPVAGDRPLRENVADALAQAKAIGARILVIDTFVRFAGLASDEENSSSAVAAAIATLEPATEAGMAVILVHHVNRREGAAGGDASRGSTALPGAVEAILDLRPSLDPGKPEHRRLHVESRIVGVRDLRLAFRRGEALGVPDRFEVLGTDAEVAGASAEAEILALLDFEPIAYTREQIQERVQARKQEVEHVLPRLAGKGKVRREGTGKRGAPYRYSGTAWAEVDVRTLSPAPLASIAAAPAASVASPAEAASHA